MSSPPDTAPCWVPSAARQRAARITHYTEWLAAARGLRFRRYEDLWQWSVDDLEAFWSSVWQYFEIDARQPPRNVLGDAPMPRARWFEGAELNLVAHVFRGRPADAAAIVHDGETGGGGSISWAELERQVAAAAATLTRLGVKRGDRVAAYLPNTPHAVIAFLAVASIGAVWSACAPDMGPISVSDRFAQIEPTVFISVDGYRYAGRDYDRRGVVAEILAALPTVTAVVWLPLLDRAAAPPPLATARTLVAWDAFVAGTVPLAVTPVPFDHPLWILYSSGTTGLPKAIVHGHGGVLLNGLVLMGLHSDVQPGARLFWISSTTWVVWNLHVFGLVCGATLCSYEGAVTGPAATPDWGFLWRYIGTQRVTHFGAGAAFFASCLKAGIDAGALADLTHLDAVFSTGSPLSEACYDWVYRCVKPDVWLASVSGGTDIVGAFVAGNPTLPVYRGEMQCRVLGVAVQAFDDDGRPLDDQVGELVCTRPIPSMPLYFWNDPGDVRYRESYFDAFVGAAGKPVWRHGDWLRLVPRPGASGAVILGRSDATINRHGIRTGSSDYYRIVEALPEVLDSLVVDLEYLGRESYLALFVVLRPGHSLTEELRAALNAAIRSGLTPRHVPNEILEVPAIPRTLTGKKLELPVKKLLLGHAADKVTRRDALANPESLDWFTDFARARPR